jgi:hypothetical protein
MEDATFSALARLGKCLDGCCRVLVPLDGIVLIPERDA